MHPSTFEYLAPTEAQKTAMAQARQAAADYAAVLDAIAPAGSDKAYVMLVRLTHTVCNPY